MHAYLAKVDFQCFAQSREFAEFSELFRNLTGITIAIYDAAGRQSKTIFVPTMQSPLCQIIHASPGGMARCEACNREHFAEAVRTRQPCRYLCHAGLVDIAIPVFIDGQHLVTISCGQLLPSLPRERGFREIMNKLRGLTISRAALREAYDRAPYLETEKIDAAIKLLTFFVEYLGRMGLTLRAMADRLERAEIVFARQYIEDHFRDRVMVGEVAKKTGLSQSHFATVFRRTVGQTFVEYLQRRRVEEAKALLINTRKIVTEICFQCGFTNLTHFNRVFRRWTGSSPRQYRQRTSSNAQRSNSKYVGQAGQTERLMM